MKKKDRNPARTARGSSRRSKPTASDKRKRLIDSLLSVDELGQVTGGWTCMPGFCQPQR